MITIYDELRFRGSMTCLAVTIVCFLGGFVNFVSAGHVMFLTFLPVLLAAPYSGAC